MVSEATRNGWQRASAISRRTLIAAAIALGVLTAALRFAPLVPAAGRTQFVTIGSALPVTTIAVVVLSLLSLGVCAIARWCMAGPTRWGGCLHLEPGGRCCWSGSTRRADTSAPAPSWSVSRVYQVAARGTKCVVEHPWGIHQDAWFWNTRPRSGRVYLVRASNYYGPHNRVANVLYISPEMIDTIPSAAWRAARRRQSARLAAARQSVTR
jgi:hypothetical protein